MFTKIEFTDDGSHTLYNNQLGESYHSLRGAVQESRHVFVDAGFEYFASKDNFRILEIGFGTGLNVLLAMLEARKRKLKVYFETIEAFPVAEKTIAQLNYADVLECEIQDFAYLHKLTWNEIHFLDDFRFQKLHLDLATYLAGETGKDFDIIYFDAFSPNTQPEMWTQEVFEALRKTLVPQGILLTYSSKGTVKQALRAAGFKVERLSGIGGKRHVLRAKNQDFKNQDFKNQDFKNQESGRLE
ncbi:MAG: tRNA (5-methylaminomethyl-2-thiouridine)(34)-methyltransferase MnmD [Prevotellaceae bacterium]|jgi:tRNA U34 5-methylaminomethyl-2-thiouridine-forming methyltransferase MnmC|nr:tRNA (5-methylaminomethyl-2-thiouridine)(34)-methyltransferase MnmD [Prevotellaceae bacterium]